MNTNYTVQIDDTITDYAIDNKVSIIEAYQAQIGQKFSKVDNDLQTLKADVHATYNKAKNAQDTFNGEGL
ncbi:hypothetical protein N9Z65_00755 [bacterium]|nr:hypothetical protein [bacterium]